MPENLKKRYEKSWARGFYEDVFSRIDETVFSVLYSEKASRPNLPVKIYVSLEILKELFGLSDEELLDRFHFDNLFIFAMGLNRVGERTISERALYYMRRRVVEYEEKTGINLFDKVFLTLKVRSTDFEIENNCIIRYPHGMTPINQEFVHDTIVARFSQESCEACPMNCFIQKNKRKQHVLEITKERLQMDIQREGYNDSEYVKKCKLRPAIEGTMFQMKLHLRNGKSKYRGKIKVKCSSIVRSMAINFKRVYAYRLKKALSYYICKNISRIRSFLFRKNSFILCNA